MIAASTTNNLFFLLSPEEQAQRVRELLRSFRNEGLVATLTGWTIAEIRTAVRAEVTK